MLTDEYICKLVSYGNGQYEYEPTGQELVRCKDCAYYAPIVDEPHKSTCQRLWGGMTECNPDSYCSDGVRKEEMEDG